MLGDNEEHRPYEDFAVRHVMGGLDDAEQGTFRSHLLDCTECRARVGELRSIASDLAEVERVERRERASQAVDTKEREAEPDTVPGRRDVRPSRWNKALVVSGVLLLIVLSIWNFVLRGQNEELRSIARAEVEAAETVNFGEPWDTVQVRPRHDAIARVLDDKLAVMVRGTDDHATYRIHLFDETGDRIRTDTQTSVDGQVRWFGGPLNEDIAGVEVVLGRGVGAETIIFRAEAPEAPTE